VELAFRFSRCEIIGLKSSTFANDSGGLSERVGAANEILNERENEKRQGQRRPQNEKRGKDTLGLLGTK